MRASGSDRNGRGFVGELMAAWVVVLLVLAVGLAATSFHGQGSRDRPLPRWFDRPVAGVQMPADDAMDPDATETANRPAARNICNIIAGSASYAQAAVSGAFAHQSGLPC